MKVYFWPGKALCGSCGFELQHDQHKRGEDHVDAQCITNDCELHGVMLRIKLLEYDALILSGYEILNRERATIWDKVKTMRGHDIDSILAEALKFYSRCPDGQYDDVVVPLIEQEIARRRG